MLFRIYFEPIDMEADCVDDTKALIMKALLEDKITVSRTLPVDENGFPILK